MTLDHQIVNVCDGATWTDPTTDATAQWRRCPECDQAARDNRTRIERGGT